MVRPGNKKTSKRTKTVNEFQKVLSGLNDLNFTVRYPYRVTRCRNARGSAFRVTCAGTNAHMCIRERGKWRERDGEAKRACAFRLCGTVQESGETTQRDRASPWPREMKTKKRAGPAIVNGLATVIEREAELCTRKGPEEWLINAPRYMRPYGSDQISERLLRRLFQRCIALSYSVDHLSTHNNARKLLREVHPLGSFVHPSISSLYIFFFIFVCKIEILITIICQ